MMTRLRSVLLLIAAAVFAPALLAQQHPNQQKGFDPASLYQFDSIDNINMFNGNLIVNIPVGPKYPVSGALSYGFNLVYNANVWDYEYPGTHLRTIPSRRSNAGVGWLLSLGRLIDPADVRSNAGADRFVYEGADGADHVFEPVEPGTSWPAGTLPPPIVARDTSRIRMMQLSSDQRRIDLPDGTSQYFDKAYPYWNLSKIVDAFGNTVTVSCQQDGTIERCAYLDPFRSQVLEFSPASPNASAYYSDRKRLTAAVLSGPDGLPQRYEFTYSAMTLSRPAGDTSGVDGATGDPVLVDMLTDILLPTGETYHMEYSTSGEITGHIRSLQLPTRGVIQWDFERFDFPQASAGLQAFTVANTIETQQFHKARAQSIGVARRRKYDLDGATLLGTWTYSRFSGPPEPCTVTISEPNPLGPTRPVVSAAQLVAVLTEPVDRRNGTDVGPVVSTASYFSVWPYLGCGRAGDNPYDFSKTEYGLPFTHYKSDGSGRFLSSETITNANLAAYDGGFLSPKLLSEVGGTLHRTQYTAYAYAREASLGHWDRDKFETASKTVFNDDASCGGPCFTESWSLSHDVFGRPKHLLSGGNSGGQHYRASLTNYYPLDVVTSASWNLGMYSEKCTRDYGQGNAYPGTAGTPTPLTTCSSLLNGLSEPALTLQSTMEQACFNGLNGSLMARRLMKTPLAISNDDLVTVYGYTDGNVTKESSLGGDFAHNAPTGDVCSASAAGATYTTDYTYTAGALATAKSGVSVPGVGDLYSVKREIDPYTGLVKSSEEGAAGTTPGFKTTFRYGAGWRLAAELPDSGAETRYTYRSATSSSGASVTVEKRPRNGSASSLLTHTDYRFDGLGRIVEESRLMPNGVTSNRRTRYFDRGVKSDTSEAESGVPSHWTELTYDALGRVIKTKAPDGHVTETEYIGSRVISRKVKVGALRGGTTITETDVTNVEEYDALGRLVAVKEDAGGSTPPVTGTITTLYAYDVADRLRTVTAGEQQRSFTYDGRGFLTAEDHPETDPATYSLFDARGHAHQKTVGGVTLKWTYDAAERVTTVADGADVPLKEFTYDRVSDAISTYTKPGRLVKSVRHNVIGSPSVDRTVSDYLVYAGVGDSLSEKTTVISGGTGFAPLTFKVAMTNDELGLPSTVTYPCNQCSGGTSTLPTRSVTNRRANGLLAEVVGYTAADAPMQYAPNGVLTYVKHANGVEDRTTIDPTQMARPKSITVTGTRECTAPQFTVTAHPDTVNYGLSTTLTAAASSGSAHYTYDWYSAAPSANATPIAVDTATYDTAPLTQGATFWVRATADCGLTADSSVAVQVVANSPTCASPVITAQPASQSVVSGSTVHLVVQATGTSLTYQWYRDNVAVLGQTASTLDAVVTSAATFHVVVSSCGATATSQSASVTTTTAGCPSTAPTIAEADQTVWYGRTVTLSTTTIAPAYQWTEYDSPNQFSPPQGHPVPIQDGGQSRSITVRQTRDHFYTVTVNPGGSCSASTSAYGGHVTVSIPPAGDFNLDGVSDIVWRNYSTGAITIQSGADNSTIVAYPGTPLSDVDWRIQAIGDINGDSYQDLIWHNNATGANAAWYWNGTNFGNSAVALPAMMTNNQIDPDWKLQAAGNLVGDARADLVFRNYRTGANRIVELTTDNSAIQTTYTLPAETVLDWKIVGIGAFDAFSGPQLLWRNYATGDNRLWSLTTSGTNVTATASTFSAYASTAAKYVAVGEYDNGAFSNTTPEVLIWNATNGTVQQAFKSGTAWAVDDNPVDATDLNWRVQGSGDFDACVTPAVTIAGAGTSCASNATLAASAPPGATYQWSTGATTSSITVTASGLYSVTVTVPGGCSSTTSARVTLNAVPTAIIAASNGAQGAVDVTAGEPLVLTASGGTSYDWSTGAHTASITVTATGDYTVTVHDANGCDSAPVTRHVTVHPVPPAGIAATAVSTGTNTFRVDLSCGPVGTGITYKFQRSSTGTAWADVAAPDTTVVAGVTYFYRALSFDGVQWSLRGPLDIATTVAFTNDPPVANVSPIASRHFTELRTAVNSVRAAAGLPAATWTTNAAPGANVSSAPVGELRLRLNEALAVLAAIDPALGPIAFTDPALAAGMPLRVQHLWQLRERVK